MAKWYISNNLEQVNKKSPGSLTAEELLKYLGFTILESDDIAALVSLPNGWRRENQGRFHNVFYGPKGQELWSFIKGDEWDRHSFLQADNMIMEEQS